MTVIDCYRLGHTLFGVVLYLFIGTLVMLLVNELSGKNTEITRQTFVIGMFTWPAVIIGFCLYVLLAYVRRVRKALSRG